MPPTQNETPLDARLRDLAGQYNAVLAGSEDEAWMPLRAGDAVALLADHDDRRRELEARREILDAVAGHVGPHASWFAAQNWRRDLREFAGDASRHVWALHGRPHLRGFATGPLVLYAVEGLYVAYDHDAHTLWGQADYERRPMYHVGLACSPPHRTCIHPLHLHAWLAHLTAQGMPVIILPGPARPQAPQTTE